MRQAGGLCGRSAGRRSAYGRIIGCSCRTPMALLKHRLLGGRCEGTVVPCESLGEAACVNESTCAHSKVDGCDQATSYQYIPSSFGAMNGSGGTTRTGYTWTDP